MNYYDYDTLATLVGTGAFTAYSLVVTVVYILLIIAKWKLFVKAGKPGWGSLIPFYSDYCLFDMAFGSGWMFLLTFIPCVNAIVLIILQFKLAKAFGQGVGFGFGLLFLSPIFYLILGFGNYEYIGPQ